MTPHLGSPLYYQALEKGLLKDCEDFYVNKHLNSDLLAINFIDLSDDEFHQAIPEANSILRSTTRSCRIERLGNATGSTWRGMPPSGVSGRRMLVVPGRSKAAGPERPCRGRRSQARLAGGVER